MDTLIIANYSQWYITQKARIVAVKDAEQGEVSQVHASKRAKTIVEGKDRLQNVHSDFMADLDDFGSLRSETSVYNNQLSDPEDKMMQELANVLSRPKVRPLRDPL